MQDRIDRGRTPKGEQAGGCKLRDAQVYEILEAYDVPIGEYRPSGKTLATRYGLFGKYVERLLAGNERSDITKNYIWKNGNPQHWSKYKRTK